MAIPDMPDAPDPATDLPAVFNQKAAAWVLAQKALPGQINAAVGNLNALLAGGAYALPYVFDTTTTDADPGVGKLRLSSTTQNAATVLRLDTTAGGADISSMLDTFDASTSGVKGSFKIVKAADLSKFLTFDIAARAAPTGYRNFTVTNTGGSSANPFVNGDAVLVFFQRNGDAGIGTGTFALLSSATVSSAVANIDFLNIFSSTYDKYVIEVEGLVPTATANLQMLLAKAGAVDTSAVYTTLATHGVASSTGQAALPLATNVGGGGGGATLTVEIRNANEATNLIKGVGVRGLFYNASGPVGVGAEAGYVAANVITGFRLYFGSGNISHGTIRVYGVKNA
jgi:hypothetical protein